MRAFWKGEPLHAWFGESWGASINETNPQVETPVDELCLFCNEPIAEHHQGFVMPFETPDGGCMRVAAHKLCQFRALGIRTDR